LLPGCCGFVGPVPSATLDKRRWSAAKTNNLQASSGNFSPALASASKNRLVLEDGQLNFAYRWFRENDGSHTPFSRKTRKQIATHIH
jgi:hypothetical protein